MDPSKGLSVLQQRKVAARMNRITTLLTEQSSSELTSMNKKELDNLLSTDTYDSNPFTESHRDFKATHNHVFATLGTTIIYVNLLKSAEIYCYLM